VGGHAASPGDACRSDTHHSPSVPHTHAYPTGTTLITPYPWHRVTPESLVESLGVVHDWDNIRGA
jgi:hypothetical protein